MTEPSADFTAAPDPATRRPYAARIVLLLMLVVGLGHFNRVGMAVAGAERIIPQYNIPTAQMGLVYTAFLITYTLAMVPGGWFIDRFGPRAALMVFCFGSAIFVALTGVVGLSAFSAHAVWLGLLVVRSLMGFVNAPLHPPAAYMVFQHVSPQKRSLANGLVTFAACVGMAATFYGFGALIDRFDWPVAFLATSGLTLVIGLIWSAGTRGADRRGDRRLVPAAATRSISAARMFRDRNIICIALSYAALGYFQYLFFYWIEYYFHTVEQQGVEVARRYSTLITLAMGVGMICGGWLADRVSYLYWPRVRRGLVPAAGMIASGAVFEAGLLSSTPQFTLGAFAAAAALIGACEGAFWTTVIELGGDHGGKAAGMMNMMGNAGGALSPYMTPLMSGYFAAHFGEGLGWRLSLAVAGIVPVLGALLWRGIETHDRHDA